ncbi:hypothetical protein M409DRAFT_63493 [Zasmidium cellare ATCC 36951]|uniref:DNA polymerase n=1 Tax=Zasmidium cellare ATCC 36951 TaxID=1080233 RepID=A0A6A6D0L8_ZASCE|nr:uncharacterized protein M409DRAFT_63493 [Zasmidium cellare ATCC 36951]KAF2171968.1 hypothetical protein M409DRAFT_63493 [Zasmidium cellare ATCC 36951]
MEGDGEDQLKRKKNFFDSIGLPSDDDETPDPGRTEAQSAIASTSSRPLARSVSDSRVNVGERLMQEANKPPSSSEPQNIVAKATINMQKKPPTSLRKTVSDVIRPKESIQNTGKRKRSDLVPAEQQLFEGLHFYFFPNDDRHPARRLRIAKAMQFGAVWDKTWNSNITHVVMDKGMDYRQLIKFLKMEKLPESVIVVSEDYVAQSITYRTLLDPKQARFAVKGLEMPSFKQVESTESDTSLPLKPPTKDTVARQPETPPAEAVEVAATALDRVFENQQLDEEEPERIPNSFEATESNKELDEAIRTARTLRDVPLDEEGESRPGTSEGPDSGDEEQDTGLKLLKQRKSKFNRLQDKFQCMEKHTGDKSNSPNQATIDVLQQMADYYGQTGDEWRIRAYRKCITSLRNYPTKITTREEAAKLPNVGPRLAEKIEEIAFTNHLRRLDNAKAEPSDQVLQTFMQVYGAGIVQANRWVRDGYRTLDELLQKADLTDNQRIGILHYEDFNSRIPRAEVAQHGTIVRKCLQAIDPSFEVIVGGSYRRGSKDSGDIDCIVTRPNTDADHLRNVVLGQLVPQLTAKGFLVASLAITSKDDGSKWHGASRLAGSKTWRRLDLLLVPSDELGAALIYFTGNDIFNRSLRLLASYKGMRLNQRGLYRDVIRGPKRVKVTEGTLVEGRDEKKIFEALGVPWRPPEHRIC